MLIIPMLEKELENEAKTTRKFLSRVPEDKFTWKPHPKSFSLVDLSRHVAELPGWVTMILTTDELDFQKSAYKPKTITSSQELLDHFEESLAGAKTHLAKATEKDLEKKWKLRNGDQIFSDSPKVEVIRMAYCQTVHHRAQLGVYLRLLDIPIPGSYGPSADEPDAF